MAILLPLLALSGCLGRDVCPPCNDTASSFLTTLSQGQTNRAFKQLFQHSLLNDKSLKSQQFVRLTNGLLRQYGEILSYETMGSQQVGRIVSTSYLLYQERGTSRWIFYFYQPPEENRWLLLDLNASDQSQYLIKPV